MLTIVSVIRFSSWYFAILERQWNQNINQSTHAWKLDQIDTKGFPRIEFDIEYHYNLWYRQKSHVTNSQRLKIVKKMKQKSLAHVSVVRKNSENLQLFPRIPKRFSFSTFEILFKLTESRILFTQLQFYILSCFLAFCFSDTFIKIE